MRKVETKIPDESALYLRRLRTEQERKEFEERYGLRLETNTPLSPFLEHLMLDMHPIFPNVAHRTVLTNTGAWNPQTIRKNTKRITDENMLQKVMGKMHDFSQWLQSAGGMDEKVCVFLVFGALFCAIVAFINESVTPLLFAVGCLCLSEGLSSPNLESEIKQIWGLQEVSSECDLPDHDLPTKNMKCYVTNGKGHKELVEIRVSKDGTKLGLYDTDGKALKPVGKGE